uniref:Protein CWC15 A n=1 Tax=Macrostomum lignano TaxID=282301 RepID=A0A1I8HWC6_9PLAT
CSSRHDHSSQADIRHRPRRAGHARARPERPVQASAAATSSATWRTASADIAAAAAAAAAPMSHRPPLRPGRLTDGSAAALPANLDADDAAVAAADLDSDADSADEGDEDEAAELMAELAKIRREREAEAARREAERQADEERIRTENILKGNPLLNKSKQGASSSGSGGGDFKVKRRWNDDVVFKNCARDDDEGRQRPASFINDTLRSEFHKKFMDKYIK